MKKTRRAPITAEELRAAVVAVVDRVGPDALSVGDIADELGTTPSALYNHVSGLDALRALAAAEAALRLTTSLQAAAIGRSGDMAIDAVATAHRTFAEGHPGLYACTLLPSDPDDAAWHFAVAGLVEVYVRVVEGLGLPTDRAVHAARSLRSAVHGFVSLERTGGFTYPQEADESFEQLLRFLTTGFRSTFLPDGGTP